MEKRVPTRAKALIKVNKTRLDAFMIKYDQDREFRIRLARVLEECRDKENLRLRAIFQDYMSFIPEDHIEDLTNKLK
jgi:hypothetical protein